jgi:hypothetical protein
MAINAITFNNTATSSYTNRYTGGSDLAANANPFIKGYFYILFELPDLFSTGNTDTDSKNNLQKLLLSSAESYTPPGDRQIKTEDIQGMGGLDSSFITGQTIDRNFSIQYKEFWGAPLFRIHRKWTSIINPYAGGLVKGEYNDITFEANSYKGKLWVIQTKPVVGTSDANFKESDIIKVDYFDGVFPRTDLKSIYDSNITDNSIVRPNVQYSFDGFPLDETNDQVLAAAVIKLNSALVGATTSNSYQVFSNLAMNSES